MLGGDEERIIYTFKAKSEGTCKITIKKIFRGKIDRRN